MNQPSKIRNREYIRQVKDFSGLSFGKIYPTDIDGFVDFYNKVFVFIEVKCGGGMPPTGQRLALERLCDACAAAGKKSVVLIATHNTCDDIEVGALQVINIRFDGKWRKPKKQITVRCAIEEFLFWASSENGKKGEP